MTQNDKPVLGFVGIGRMGTPMARRLLEAGYRVAIHDTQPQAVQALAALGAQAAPSPRAVADAASIVLVSLPKPDIVRDVVLGTQGLVHGTAVRIVVDLSTSGATAARELARGLGERGIASVDCPVSGGVAGATKGTLALMLSGPRDACDALGPVLDVLGKSFYIGEQPGLAQTMKVINNLVSVTALAVTSEALVMGVKAGLDPDIMVQVINSGSGRSNASEDKIPKYVLSRSFGFGFALGLSAKDVGLCLAESEAIGAPLRVGSAVRELLDDARERLGDEADLTEIVRLSEAAAGVEVRGKAAGKA
ncbi:NAD(P)-dependent oxidoreductase [Bordetella bronchialis]|uniref:Oxidoreductase n=1 Tax=Bordetella bronchialis TaxID=463025 RepID=A0ABN4QY71_9BORD|nr:NAD(P)-dependent oxidoreductase [Bordetella bronchialis]ANN65969.1 oxidoreductase [Bordetella bronchialis]